MQNKLLNITDFTDESPETCGLQAAIDALPVIGGTVFIPAGEYTLRRSVVLRSNVTLRGEGAASILTRPPERSYKLTHRTVRDKTHLRVKSAAGLKLGDEVLVGDNTQGGYHARHGIVREVRKGAIDLELLECDPERTYSPARDARVSNLFPALWLPRVHNVTIESLTIDGQIERHRQPRGNFTCAGIHTRHSTRVRVMNVNVMNWPGDGIGLQSGDGVVSSCFVDNCRGPGLHPGTGIEHSIWANNVSQRNTLDGFFFCMRVMHAVVHGNLLLRNRRHGIGGLTDPDQYNVVQGNICVENARHGIEAKRAIGNSIVGNLLRNNSQEKAGEYAGIYLEEHRGNTVLANTFIDDQDKPTQRKKIVSLNPSGENVIQSV